jgi:hypothetical protein
VTLTRVPLAPFIVIGLWKAIGLATGPQITSMWGNTQIISIARRITPKFSITRKSAGWRGIG